MNITKNNINGHISESKLDRNDSSLKTTSTLTFQVKEIHKSLKDVPKGFFVVYIFTYCSTKFFLTVIKETESPVPRYSYHLSKVSSSKTTLEKVPSLYCFKKSFIDKL
jgi:hypothetical protein